MPPSRLLLLISVSLYVGLFEATFALAQALPTSIVPAGFNPHTCETDREPPASLSPQELRRWRSSTERQYTLYSCDALRLAYAWEPIQRAILDAKNSIPHPGSDFSDPNTTRRLRAALASLATSAARLQIDHQRPENEARDLLGDWLNFSQKVFAERGWEPPGTMREVFADLEARAAKAYVPPVEQQTILLVASERAGALFLLSNQALKSMIAGNDAEAREKAIAERKRVEAERLAAAGYFESVKARAAKFPGFGRLLLGSALLAGAAALLFRRRFASPKHAMVAFVAGTVALFLAQLGAGTVQLISGVPTWLAFVFMFLAFGVLYVLSRDRLSAMLPAAAGPASHGSAAWASLQDAIDASRVFERGMVSADSYGFALGRVARAPSHLDPRLRYMGHVLTCAPTGSGKGVGAVIPTLLEYPGSVLCLDIKGENYAVTSRARRALGQSVFLVDPFGVTGGQPSAFNPLDVLDLSNPDVVGQASALVDMLVIVGANQDDSSAHFNDSAKDLIKGLLVYARGLPDPTRRTLGEVRRILTLPLTATADSGRESLLDHLSGMSANEDMAFGIPARAANGFISKEAKEASGVLSTAQRHTAFLDDPRVARALARSDFSFAALKRDPMTVYVVLPPDRLAAQTRFMRVLVGAALSAITATSDKPQFNALFLLDEFAQLGRMPAIEDAISLVRGYGARFWLFVQDLSHLKGVYPKWQTFLANSAKQFYGTADYETAKYVSDMLGQSTIEFRTMGDSSSTSFQGGGSSGTNTSQQLAARSLLTADEVMRHGSARPIVLIQGERPYSLERLNYLSDPEYLGLADANPFHR